MCARFYRYKDLKDLAKRFQMEIFDEALDAQYNIAPTEKALVIPATREKRAGKLLTFGQKDAWGQPGMLVNLRSESFIHKPRLQQYLKGSRVFIPVDGFYEWKRDKTGSTPYRFGLKGEAFFGLAGVVIKEGFVILTTEPNPLVAEVHNRMPVMIRPEEEKVWLDANVTEFNQLVTLMAPYPAEAMDRVQVSKLVNSAKNKGKECLS